VIAVVTNIDPEHLEHYGSYAALEAVGAARRLDPRTLSAKDLGDALRSLLADPDRLVAMGRAAAGLARPLAASDIAAECRALARADAAGAAGEEPIER
jgi:UDP-N-acetylglucosamine:LPS N-acetylglucosamine transferase